MGILKGLLASVLVLGAGFAWSDDFRVGLQPWGAELGDPDTVEPPSDDFQSLPYEPKYEGGELGDTGMVPYTSPSLELKVQHPAVWDAPFEDSRSATLYLASRFDRPDDSVPKLVFMTLMAYYHTDDSVWAALTGLNGNCAWKTTKIDGHRAFFCHAKEKGLLAVLRGDARMLVVEFSDPDGSNYERTIKRILSSIQFDRATYAY